MIKKLIPDRIKRLIRRDNEALIIGIMIALLFGAGVAHATFYRTSGSTGVFDYGYGYSSDDGYGYGYGWHSDDGENNNQGFFGTDGKATGVSASVSQTTITITYTTDYLAKNRINYGGTTSFGSNSSQTSFETGENSIQLTSLSCGNTYYYRVESTDAGSNVWYSTATYHTAQTSDCTATASSGGGGGGGGGGGSSSSSSQSSQTTTSQLTPAGGLSHAQVSSILEVLESFGADAETIAKVQAALYALPPVISSTVSATPSFTNDLTIGSTGGDVLDLQKFLNSQGYQVAESGPGSPGNETNTFGSLTRAALAKFQEANGISPASGYFGPITRGFIANMTSSIESTSESSSTGQSFTRDLTIGSTGGDVLDLQKFLNSQGYQVAESGPGSPGNETNTFGSLTKAALAKFQEANGISPASGYFGPITRSFIEK